MTKKLSTAQQSALLGALKHIRKHGRIFAARMVGARTTTVAALCKPEYGSLMKHVRSVNGERQYVLTDAGREYAAALAEPENPARPPRVSDMDGQTCGRCGEPLDNFGAELCRGCEARFNTYFNSGGGGLFKKHTTNQLDDDQPDDPDTGE